MARRRGCGWRDAAGGWLLLVVCRVTVPVSGVAGLRVAALVVGGVVRLWGLRVVVRCVRRVVGWCCRLRRLARLRVSSCRRWAVWCGLVLRLVRWLGLCSWWCRFGRVGRWRW